MSHSFALGAGEVELRQWGLSGRSFLWRCAVLALITMLIPGALVPVEAWWQRVFVAVFSALFYMWVFDDFRIWRDNRNTVWLLTNQALHVHGPQVDEDIDLRLPLTDIRRIGPLPPWSLVLRLQSGTAITLPLVPERRALRKEILAARDALITSETA